MVSALNCRRILPLLTALILLAATLLSDAGQPFANPGFTNGESSGLNSAVIKTQRWADKIEDGIRGIDVSKYNGTINWQKVATDNVDFAFIRSTCGYQPNGVYQLNIDPLFLENAAQAHANGIKVGAYHVGWFLSRDIMLSEADTFIEMLEQVDITYPVILDLEYNPGRLSRDELSSLAKEFCDIVASEGYTVFIYSYSNFFKEYLDLEKLGDYKLWVANYGETPKNIPHSIWQHTSFGSVKGIKGNVDINVAYPDFEERKYSKVSVSRKVSDLIKERLRERYKLNVPETGLKGIHEAVNSAIQKEINAQWNVSLPVNGVLTKKQMDYLCEINFTGKTKGNITYLIQARLFFMGYYSGQPTAVFDQNTRNAVKSFQIDKKLGVSGELANVTLIELLK